MKTSFFLTIILLTGHFCCFSQVEPPVVVPPSPEVQAFKKYGDIPVSPYTGVPDISIPIYQIQEGDISVPITLSYHASGIKVDQEATWVGLGWSLHTGGLISRTVNGKDDIDGDKFYFRTPEVGSPSGGKLPLPFQQHGCFLKMVDNYNNHSSMDLEPFAVTPARYANYDFEPDDFSYSILGSSGEFVLDKAGNPVLAKKNRMNINVNPAATIWSIKGENGFVYTFEDLEQTRDYKGSLVKTTWYLSRIDSPSGKYVTFHYTSMDFAEGINASVFEQWTRFIGGECDPAPPNVFSFNYSQHYTKKVLESIEFSSGVVKFDFDRSRTDLEMGEKLNAVKIYRKQADGQVEANPLKVVNFGYDYFTGRTGDDDMYIKGAPSKADMATHIQRLKLVSLTESSETKVKGSYYFKYYELATEEKLPAKGSFARDFWGYYNGAIGNVTLVPEHKGYIHVPTPNHSGYFEFEGAKRISDSRYTKAFSLKEIQYPTGGITEFKYEINDFDFELSNVNDLSSGATNPDLVPLNVKAEYHKNMDSSTGCEKPIDLNSLYKDPNSGTNATVKLSGAFVCLDGCEKVNAVNKDDVVLMLYKENGDPLLFTEVSFAKIKADGGCKQINACSFNASYTDLSPGLYTWKLKIKAGITGITMVDAAYSSYKKAQKENIGIGGGLRVAEIIDYENAAKIKKSVKKYIYNYREDKNGDGVLETYSYGRRMAKPRHGRLDFGKQELSPVRRGYCYNYVRTSSSNISLNGTGGAAVGYDRVTVLHGENGEFGKTEYHFENHPDGIWNYNQYRLPGIPNYKSNLNGSLLYQAEYAYLNNGSYKKVSEVTNEYYPVSANTPGMDDMPVFGLKIDFDKTYANFGSEETGCWIYTYVYPAIKSDWIKLKYSWRKDFSQENPESFVETKTEYRYENEEHMQLTSKVAVDSKGNELITKFKYPHDYASPSVALAEMISRNIINSVIEKIESVNGKVAAASGTEFNFETEKDKIYPLNVFLLETAQPLSSFSESTDGRSFSSYQKKATFHRYDGKGNILEFSQENGVKTVYIWGHSQTLPVAQIVNASFADVESIFGTDFHTGNQGLTAAQEETLRNSSKFRNSFVTTFYYDPLLGLTKSVDPNQNKVEYLYDNLGRLELVKDHDGNIIKKYEYNYAIK